MQTVRSLALILCLLFSALFFSSLHGNKEISKREALREIKDIKRNARMHKGAIRKIRSCAKDASCCYNYFVVYAQKASEVSTSTLMFVQLANVTSGIQEPKPGLLAIAGVVGSNKLGYAEFEELVKMALKANTIEKEREVLRKVNSYRE